MKEQALLAFGAVGGIESGVTIGENFNVSRLLRPNPNSKPFGPQPRVYVQSLALFLARGQAADLLRTRHIRAWCAYTDTNCCRHGVEDMIADPRRHFVITRMDEVSLLSQPPEPMRAGQYLENILRPATDRIIRALRVQLTAETRKKLQNERRKLESWRYTLGEMAHSHPARTYSVSPARRAVRRRLRGA